MQITLDSLQILCDIAQKAGRAIMDFYMTDCTIVTKSNNSPLTQADVRADAIIRAGLEQHFPGLFILSEESTSANSSEAGVFFLVDPLDGTKEFLSRNGEFTVNIALIDSGTAIAGVVFAPALDELFFAAQGLGSWKTSNGITQAIQTQALPPAGQPLRVVSSRSHGVDSIGFWLNVLQRDYTLVPIGSSLKFCRLAEGQADIYPRLGATSQWDTAAGQCILEVAGGKVLMLDRQVLQYGLERPILNKHFIACANYHIQV